MQSSLYLLMDVFFFLQNTVAKVSLAVGKSLAYGLDKGDEHSQYGISHRNRCCHKIGAGVGLSNRSYCYVRYNNKNVPTTRAVLNWRDGIMSWVSVALDCANAQGQLV